MSTGPTQTTETDPFLQICRNERPPLPEQYQAGRAARDADLGFHEGPRPIESIEALSWRLGWNDRALELSRELQLRPHP
ncbi:MAG: hypothetical protein ACRYG8_06655 [Janthinobacterium lividum]